MRVAELVKNVTSDDLKCFAYLRQHGIMNETEKQCSGKRNIDCGAPMRRVIRHSKNVGQFYSWRCTKWSCQTFQPVRTNRIFTLKDCTGRKRSSLSLSSIVLIVYLWLFSEDSVRQISSKTGHAMLTVIDWLNLCREVCSIALESEPKWTGTEQKPIQIDEALFQGKRKYKRGRLREADKKHKNERLKQKRIQKSTPHIQVSKSNRNHCERVCGPWVFGLYKDKHNVRFRIVKDRTASTLIPLIKERVTPMSVVVSDEWRAYYRLIEHGFIHETVNHSRNFVNPFTGFHTQAIERAWVDGKAWVKRARIPNYWIGRYPASLFLLFFFPKYVLYIFPESSKQTALAAFSHQYTISTIDDNDSLLLFRSVQSLNVKNRFVRTD